MSSHPWVYQNPFLTRNNFVGVGCPSTTLCNPTGIIGTILSWNGASYTEMGGKNESAIHMDLVCDLHDGEIVVGGELIYRNGEFII